MALSVRSSSLARKAWAAHALDGAVPPLLELEGGVDGHFFAPRLPERFGPRRLARVALFHKVFAAF